MVKEGFSFLSTDEEYRGMFNDQKDSNTDWQQETELSTATSNNVRSKAETYCGKLNEDLPDSTDPNYESTRRKLIAFCTSGGIKTVKGKLIQNKKSG